MSLRVQSVGILALIVGLVSAAHFFDSGGFLSDDQVDNTDNLVKDQEAAAAKADEGITRMAAEIKGASIHFGDADKDVNDALTKDSWPSSNSSRALSSSKSSDKDSALVEKENKYTEESFEPLTIAVGLAAGAAHFIGGAGATAGGAAHFAGGAAHGIAGSAAHFAGGAHGAGQLVHGAGHVTIHYLKSEIRSKFLSQISEKIDRHTHLNTRYALDAVMLSKDVMSSVTHQIVNSALCAGVSQMCRDAARAVASDTKKLVRDLVGRAASQQQNFQAGGYHQQNFEPAGYHQQNFQAGQQQDNSVYFYHPGYYSLVQVPTSPVDQENPGAGFDGAYSGNQAESKGLVRPLEVIKSDSERTIQMKEDAEKQQAADLVEYEQNNQAIIGKKSTKKTLDNEAA